MLKLWIKPADGEPQEHVVEQDEVVIGRSPRCDVAVADRFLSRQHLRLYRASGGWLVEDLGSRNGTFVNGRRVAEPSPVKPGDVIAVSATTIDVRDTESPDESAGIDLGQSILRPATMILSRTEEGPGIAATVPQDALRHYAERLQILHEVHQTLSKPVELEDLLDLILDRVFVHLRPQQAAIFLEHDDELVRATTRLSPGVADDFPVSKSLQREVVTRGQAALVTDTASDERFAEAKSIVSAGVRTIVAAPLLTHEGALGMIVLGSTLADRQFSEDDLELLVPLASVAAMRIRNLKLAEEAAERRHFEQEVALARRIQEALLPEGVPDTEGYELYGGNTPSRGVSGDYFQLTPRADGRELALLIADVSGKGIGASLLTGYVDALSVAYVGEGFRPDEILAKVSPQLHAKTPPDRFATAFLGILDVAIGTVDFASAGHDPSIVVRVSGEIEWLMPTGLPLGLLPIAEYTADEVTLEAGDMLVMYTDGITEANNPEEEEYGRDRLAEVCRDNRQRPLDELVDAINDAVDDFTRGVPYHDDRTMIVLRRTD